MIKFSLFYFRPKVNPHDYESVITLVLATELGMISRREFNFPTELSMQ